MGNAIAANLFLVGYAIQKGLFPISLTAVERAIELNGVSVQMNKESIYWGRLAAIDIKKVESIALNDVEAKFVVETLDSVIDDRYDFLVGYQNKKYAATYINLVNKTIETEKKLNNSKQNKTSVKYNISTCVIFKLSNIFAI